MHGTWTRRGCRVAFRAPAPQINHHESGGDPKLLILSVVGPRSPHFNRNPSTIHHYPLLLLFSFGHLKFMANVYSSFRVKWFMPSFSLFFFFAFFSPFPSFYIFSIMVCRGKSCKAFSSFSPSPASKACQKKLFVLRSPIYSASESEADFVLVSLAFTASSNTDSSTNIQLPTINHTKTQNSI